MFKRKNKSREKIEEIIEDKVEQPLECEIEVVKNEEEKFDMDSEKELTEIIENPLVDEKAEDNKASELETNIEISKELMDGKGIDVVKVEQENTLIDDGKIEIKTTISTKNYDETVVKLINEVKIFSDDEDDLGIKNKRSIWPIILVAAVLLCIAAGIYYYLCMRDKDSSQKEEKGTITDNAVLYRYEQTESGINFYGDNKLISTYECEDCEAYSFGQYEYFSKDSTVLAIEDDKEVFLYDYTLNQIIGEKYTQLQNIIHKDETVSFIATNDKGLSGIIDLRGNLLVPFEYEALGYSINDEMVSDYSYSSNIITAKKDGYWGAINFKGEQVIPFEYEDVYYNGYDAIVVFIDGLWYLNDLNNNRLIETGYDIIIPINSYVFAAVNNVFYILNYDGESIISNEVPTYLNEFRSRDSIITPAFKIEEEETMVNIYIMNSENSYSQYKFNTVNGELTEIIQ